MSQPTRRFTAIAGMIVAGTLVMAAATPDGPMFHERKEVAGLAIVFGAEPEPALTDEMQNLMWRVSSLAEEEPYTEMSEAKVTITFEGESFGPFDVRAVRRTPGEYTTRHVFTEVGEYTSVLTFKKGEESTEHSVDFNFNIGNRADLEIPKRRGGG